MATQYSGDPLIVQIKLAVKNERIGKITFSHFIEDLIFRREKVIISTKKYNQHAQRVMKSIIFFEV